MNIHGWETIVPQLATYFYLRQLQAELRRNNPYLTPFNLFLSGVPGTNKSKGALQLSHHLGLSAESVDCSTLDDIAELAGVIDLNANREHGQSSIIEGSRLKARMLILDELANARPHVMPQCREFLLGNLTLLGKSYPMETESIIATGNLSDDMQEGEANSLDSPTADRFAMVIQVPSLAQMSQDDVLAIALAMPGSKFGAAFQSALDGIKAQYQLVERRYREEVTKYCVLLAQQLGKSATNSEADRKRKVFAFEGRRLQLLMQFATAAVALCAAQPHRDRKETLFLITRDVLSYHRLSGLELDMALLRATCEEVYSLAFTDKPIEAIIASEPSLRGKMNLLVNNLAHVHSITKIGVIAAVIESDDIGLKLALKDLVASEVFAPESAELRKMVERVDLSEQCEPIQLTAQKLLDLSRMSPAEAIAFGLAGGDMQKKDELMDEVNRHLHRWGVRKAH